MNSRAAGGRGKIRRVPPEDGLPEDAAEWSLRKQSPSSLRPERAARAEEDRRVGETSSRRHRNIRGGTKEDPTATVPAGRARTKMAEVRRVVKRKSREKKRD